MADSAAQAVYRAEYVAGYEQKKNLLRGTVTTDADIRGTTAVVLVADSGADVPSTRGLNGLITAQDDNLTQNTVTLIEWNDLRKATNFNIFTSQGNRKRIMQDNSLAVMHRRIDLDILTELANCTQHTGAAKKASLDVFMHALAILGNASATDGEVSCVISPGAHAYLMQTTEFASADFVDRKKFTGGVMNAYNWAGINFIVHPNIVGKGTASEKLYMYNKNAVSHICDKDSIAVETGYMAEQGYSWARTQAFMGSKIIQNTGIVQIIHDGSAYAAL